VGAVSRAGDLRVEGHLAIVSNGAAFRSGRVFAWGGPTPTFGGATGPCPVFLAAYVVTAIFHGGLFPPRFSRAERPAGCLEMIPQRRDRGERKARGMGYTTPRHERRSGGVEQPNDLAVRRQFASDNWSGVCPEAMKALEEANRGHVHAYGEDPYTDRACALLREFFETDCEVFFMFNGTAANSVALAHLCNSYNSVICHELAHVETDEAGAPEFFSNGTKVLLAPGDLGKVAPSAVEHLVTRRADIHYPKPRV